MRRKTYQVITSNHFVAQLNKYFALKTNYLFFVDFKRPYICLLLAPISLMEAFSTLEDIFSLIFVGNIDWFLSSNQHAVFGSLNKMAELKLLTWQTLKQCFNISFNSLWEAHYIRVLFLTDNFISF